MSMGLGWDLEKGSSMIIGSLGQSGLGGRGARFSVYWAILCGVGALKKLDGGSTIGIW